ncbi:MAG: hypothetical protein ACLRTZ_15380 [Agathobacter sp.]
MSAFPVMHTDCTNARVNGESSYVFVCAVPDGGVLYFARDKKGHDGIKGTVVEDYQGTLVHDHDVTFYKYGTKPPGMPCTCTALSERQHGQRKRPYLEQADAFPDTGNDPLPEWFI